MSHLLAQLNSLQVTSLRRLVVLTSLASKLVKASHFVTNIRGHTQPLAGLIKPLIHGTSFQEVEDPFYLFLKVF